MSTVPQEFQHGVYGLGMWLDLIAQAGQAVRGKYER